jgi:poly(ADP-ribose) glycohydrolase ARH3
MRKLRFSLGKGVNMLELKSKFIGAMIGSALGDAIGERAFRSPLHNKPETDTLRWTDDTAMAIGLAESLLKVGHVDEKDLGDTFRRHFAAEPNRGYAGGPPKIFATMDQDREHVLTYSKAASYLYGGTGSLGNGAAMRITPLALFDHTSPDFYDEVKASSMITHTHAVGIDGAWVLACAIAEALRLDPLSNFDRQTFCKWLISSAKTSEIQKKLIDVYKLVESDLSPQIASSMFGSGVEAQESVPFAIYSFLKNPLSFKDCLYCAVGNGGDRDTLGAMACAISGAYLGIEAIPQEWVLRLEQVAYIEHLATQLFEAKFYIAV